VFELPNDVAMGGALACVLPEPLRRGRPAVPPPADPDAAAMAAALRRAMEAIGRTHPNPAVGAVLVRDGRILAEGATEAYGGRHAERVCLDGLPREATAGATLYVTLEPCAHHGRQPPCADFLAGLPLARVVAAIGDPNPLVGGRGVDRVRAAGIAVETGVLADAALAWHLPFLHWHTEHRVLFAGKWAQTLDGQLAYDDRSIRWLSGPPALAYAHWLRQRYDAIVVGAGTVLADFPRLTVRDCAPPHARNPVRVAVDPSGRIAAAADDTFARILGSTFDDAAPSVLATGHAAADALPADRRATLEAVGTVVLPLPEGPDFLPALAEALGGGALARAVGRPIQSAMVEGGPQLLGRFGEAGLLHVAHAFVTPRCGGGRQFRIARMAPPHVEPPMATVQCCRLGEDVLIEYCRPDLADRLAAACRRPAGQAAARPVPKPAAAEIAHAERP